MCSPLGGCARSSPQQGRELDGQELHSRRKGDPLPLRLCPWAVLEGVEVLASSGKSAQQWVLPGLPVCLNSMYAHVVDGSVS